MHMIRAAMRSIQKFSVCGAVEGILRRGDRSVNLIVLGVFLLLVGQISEILCGVLGVENSMRVVFVVLASFSFMAGLRMYCE